MFCDLAFLIFLGDWLVSFAELTEPVSNDDSSFVAVDSGIRSSSVGPDTQACTPPDWPQIRNKYTCGRSFKKDGI